MSNEEYEEEFEEIKKKRSGGFTSLIKNMSNWQFVSIIILVIIFVWLLGDKTTPKTQLLVIGFAILAILFYSQKGGAPGLISEDVAKKIAVEGLENKKEDYHIPSDADIVPTNFCYLQDMNAQPYKWHIGMKIEDRFNKIDYWRVVIHPYDGVIIGIVREPTGFEGREFKDIVVVAPEFYEKK